MLNHFSYRKFISLGNGKRIMFRLLSAHDGEVFGRLLQDAPPEDIMFLKEDFQDPKALTAWLEQLQNRRVIPLVAVDLEAHRFIGSANLYLGKHSARHIGEVRIFVAEPFRNKGLGSMMLEELLHLALKEDLHWLKAEVIGEHKKLINAFRSKGFEVKAFLEDYFMRQDGVTHDVVLMMRPVLREEEGEF